LKYLGKKIKEQKRKWFNDKFQNAIEEMDTAKSVMFTSPNTENNRNYNKKGKTIMGK
jgi:hypothetical protein